MTENDHVDDDHVDDGRVDDIRNLRGEDEGGLDVQDNARDVAGDGRVRDDSALQTLLLAFRGRASEPDTNFRKLRPKPTPEQRRRPTMTSSAIF